MATPPEPRLSPVLPSDERAPEGLPKALAKALAYARLSEDREGLEAGVGDQGGTLAAPTV